MIERTISKEIIEEANKHSSERMQFEYNRFKLSSEQRKTMILIGTIGQLLFKEYVTEQKVPFEFEYQAGSYDAMDFKLGQDIVEIKTSGYEDNVGFEYLNLLYNKDQFDGGIRKGFKYCVLLFINGYSRKTKLLNLSQCSKGIIAGYIPFEKIQEFPNAKQFYGDDFKVPLAKFSDIKQLTDNYI